MCNKKHIPRFSQIKLGYCTLSSDSLVGWIWWFERLPSKHSVSTSRHKLCRNVSQHDPESSRLFPRCRGALTPWWFIICYVTARGESISQWDSAAEVRTLVLFTLLFALRWRRITTGRFKIWIFHLTTFDSVWPSQSCRRSRWSLCLSGWVLKRLQVFFPPHKHYRSSFSAEQEEHNVRGDDWTMFLCQTHCRWCGEDNMEVKLSLNSGTHTHTVQHFMTG